MIISITNTKGGVGKSTIAMMLAEGLCQKGSVFLVDMDPQGSSYMWAKRKNGEEITSLAYSKSDVGASLKPLMDNHDFTIIDTPPGNVEIIKAAVSISDKIIVPILPGALDLWAAQTMFAILEKYKKTDESIMMVVNRDKAGSKGAKTTSMGLQNQGYRVIGSIPDRVSFYTDALEGKTPYSTSRGHLKFKLEKVISEAIQ